MLKERLKNMGSENGKDQDEDQDQDQVALLITSIEKHMEPEPEESEPEDDNGGKLPSSSDEAVELAGRSASSTQDFLRKLDDLGYQVVAKSVGKTLSRRERMSAYNNAKRKVQQE